MDAFRLGERGELFVDKHKLLFAERRQVGNGRRRGFAHGDDGGVVEARSSLKIGRSLRRRRGTGGGRDGGRGAIGLRGTCTLFARSFLTSAALRNGFSSYGSCFGFGTKLSGREIRKMDRGGVWPRGGGTRRRFDGGRSGVRARGLSGERTRERPLDDGAGSDVSAEEGGVMGGEGRGGVAVVSVGSSVETDGPRGRTRRCKPVKIAQTSRAMPTISVTAIARSTIAQKM
jgi:hypothetical protein